MKMKKVLSLVLAASMVLGSFSVAAANPTTTTADQFGRIVESGIFKGDNGDLMLDKTFNRAEFAAVALRLMGAGFGDSETEALKIAANFKDVKVGDWFSAYVGRAQKEGLVQGDPVSGLYMPTDNVTYVQALTIVMRALGYQDGTDLTNYPSGYYTKAVQLGLADSSIKADAKIVRKVIAEMLETALDLEVKGGTHTLAQHLGIEEVVAVELAVESVKAIKANTIKVEFNKAVEDVTFEVKRGTVSVPVTATLAADKMSAELVRTANFVEGDYTVKVSGIDGVKELKIEAQKVASIEVLGAELVKNTAGTNGTFRYEVKDQYGTDITKNVPQSAFTLNAIVGSSTATGFSLTPATGTGTVTHTFGTNDKTATIIMLHSATGKSVTSNLDVAAAVTVDSFQFGNVKLPTNKSRVETGLTEAATIAITAYDQYGFEIKNASVLSGALQLVSSQTGVTFTFATEDNKPVIKMNTASLTENKTVILTVLANATGKTFTTNFEIVKASEPNAIELGEIAREVIAIGDTNVHLPLVVLNQFGDVLTADQMVTNATPIQNWISLPTGVTGAINTDKNSSNYGKYLLNFASATKGTKIITAVAPAGFVSKTIEVKDVRVVSEVANLATINLMQGATKALEFSFSDQYQQVIPRTGSTTLSGGTYNNADLTYNVTLEKVSGDTDAVTTSFVLTGANESALNSITVNAASNKKGTYKLTVELLDGTAVVSSAYVNINVVENSTTGLTYSVKSIPTLAGDSTYGATSPYAAKVEVEAKDANGATYVINKADVIEVVSSNADVADAAKNGSDWYVFGKDVTGISPATADKTATITIKLNTLSGFQFVTQEVTVSPKVSQVQAIRVIDPSTASATLLTELTTAGGSRRDTLPAAVTNKLVYSMATKDVAVSTGETLYVVGKDQYGVWKKLTIASNNVVVNTTNHAPIDAFIMSTDNIRLALAKAELTAVNKDILVTITQGVGAQQITVKVAAEGTVVATEIATAKATLLTNISTAQGIHNAEVVNEGTTAGDQVVGSSTTFQTAITAATAVHSNTSATLAQVNAAITALNTAQTTYVAAIVQ